MIDPDHASLLLAELRLQAESKLQRLRWRADPALYALERLGITLVPKVAEAARAVAKHRLVMVNSCNAYGKSIFAAVIALWNYDTRDPSMTVVTAPTDRQVKLVMFREIRKLDRGQRPGFSPKAAQLEDHNDHMLTGYTATDENSFQGVRSASTGIVIEEHNGIDRAIFTAIRGMAMGGEDKWCVAIGNPVDPAAPARAEAIDGGWRVFRWSAFEHPNIPAELAGEPPVVRDAVRLADLAGDGEQVGNLAKWGEFVPDGQQKADDVDLEDPATYGLVDDQPPRRQDRQGEAEKETSKLLDSSDIGVLGALAVKSLPPAMLDGIRRVFPTRFWRATTPEGEARILALYPSQGVYSAYAEVAWSIAAKGKREWVHRLIIVLGCDVARHGRDASVIHGQVGGVSVLHEVHKHRDTKAIADRLKDLAREWGAVHNCKPDRIPLVIDDTGVGGGVTDQLGGFHRVPINALQLARMEVNYPDARSEMHFDLASRLLEGKASTARLPADVREELARQSLAIKYELPKGRRKVIPTKLIEKELGRSPDDLTGMALAYYLPSPSLTSSAEVEVVKPPVPMYRKYEGRDEPVRDSGAGRRGGRGYGP